MIKFKNIFLIIFSSVCLSSSANLYDHKSDLKTISENIPQFNNITCKFRQEKQIDSMVIKSSGNFEFDKEKGVVFYITYPIKSTTSYTSREYKQINSIITAISNKSYSRLEKDFDFYWGGEGVNKDTNMASQEGVKEEWQLGLIPRPTSPAYNHLKSIEITGEKDIKKIVILTCDKTKTTIWFE